MLMLFRVPKVVYYEDHIKYTNIFRAKFVWHFIYV